MNKEFCMNCKRLPNPEWWGWNFWVQHEWTAFHVWLPDSGYLRQTVWLCGECLPKVMADKIVAASNTDAVRLINYPHHPWAPSELCCRCSASFGMDQYIGFNILPCEACNMWVCDRCVDKVSARVLRDEAKIKHEAVLERVRQKPVEDKYRCHNSWPAD